MREKIRGVNLGGWLVLEKWMKPELFDGTDAADETGLSKALSPEELQRRLEEHRASFITEEDFAWIAETGLNTVRLPVPWWMFGDVPPYLGCQEWVEKAFRWAEKYGLDVMLDLHCAPGCQNGFDNGGIAGVMEWHLKEENIQKTLDTLERICEFVKPFPALASIQLLNEPHWDIPLEIVEEFYRRGYALVRRHFSPERCTVVLHDSFRQDVWENSLTDVEGVLMDAHFYQFQDEYLGCDYFQHAKTTLEERRRSLQNLTRNHEAIVGEWSLGYPLEDVGRWNAYEKELALRGFAANQLEVYEETRGWIFWSYRVTESMGPWSLRVCVEQGWLPRHF